MPSDRANNAGATVPDYSHSQVHNVVALAKDVCTHAEMLTDMCLYVFINPS